MYIRYPLSVVFQEYILQDVRDRQQLIVMHKKAKKGGVDLNQYNMLKQEAVRIQYMLKKLRNPLKLKIPPNVAMQTGPIVAEAVPVTEEKKADASTVQVVEESSTEKAPTEKKEELKK